MKKGLLIVSGLLITAGVGLYVNAQIKLAKQICVKTGSVKISKLGINSTRAVVPVTIKNVSDVSVQLKSANIKVYVGKGYVGTVTNQLPAIIAKHDSVTFPVEFEFSPKKLIPELKGNINIFKLRDTQVNLKGGIILGWNGIPIRIGVDQSFTLNDIGSSSGNSSCD